MACWALFFRATRNFSTVSKVAAVVLSRSSLLTSSLCVSMCVLSKSTQFLTLACLGVFTHDRLRLAINVYHIFVDRIVVLVASHCLYFLFSANVARQPRIRLPLLLLRFLLLLLRFLFLLFLFPPSLPPLSFGQRHRRGY